ncbi:MAG: hypothetical protein H7Y31_17110 [Chitinophagaceae bacterium]|nr:hypothetical protein [Chitinophagaceae bacterium]
MVLSKIFILCLAFFIGNTAYGQSNMDNNAFWNDANGRPLKINTGFRVEGTPFYNELYCLADVVMMNGRIYKGIKVKFNLADNNLIFVTNSGEEMAAASPVRSVTFHNYAENNIFRERVNLTSFSTALNQPGAEIYEVLVDTGLKLMKKIQVTYADAKPYNEATITRTYNRKEVLYALPSGPDTKAIKISRNANDLLPLFGDKQSEMKVYLRENKVNFKSDQDLQRIFEYYNSLKKG